MYSRMYHDVPIWMYHEDPYDVWAIRMCRTTWAALLAARSVMLHTAPMDFNFIPSSCGCTWVGFTTGQSGAHMGSPY